MKKIILGMFFVIAILCACNTSTVSLSVIENVPEDVQNIIDPNFKLQLINDGENGSYIIFHSSGNVEFDFETHENKVTINFNEQEEGVEKQNIYYLTTDPKQEEIEVLINGESRPFDTVTGL